LLSLTGPNGVIRFKVRNNGQVGIGMDPGNSNNLLSVNGDIVINGRVTAIEIETKPNVWADNVFNPDYQQMSLADLDKFIKINRHLPGVPKEEEVKQKGINLGDMNVLLLRKIEELTNYLLEQQKTIAELKLEIESLKTH
jgi:hypothetical protein